MPYLCLIFLIYHSTFLKVTSISQSLPSLLCQASFKSDNNDNVIEWDIGSTKSGVSQPTEEEVDVKLASMISDWDAQEYARNRASAFPSIGDQLDMQYHDQLDGTTTWKDAIAKVKSDNPKE